MNNFAHYAAQARRPGLVVEPGHLPSICDNCDSRDISVCSAIDSHELHRLAAAAVVTQIEPGRCFIAEGEPADNFYNITSGTAKIYKLLPDGRRQITGFATRGDFLGLAVSQNYAFSAEAIESLRYCRFSRQGLRTVLSDFPEMERRLLTVASNELVAAQEQMLLLGRKTARERLASFLLSLALKQGDCPHQSGVRVHLPMTRGDIADYLGLTIETVSRNFTRLKNEGLIALQSTDAVTLNDRDGLVQLAEGYCSE